jgi:hypothetical protein
MRRSRIFLAGAALAALLLVPAATAGKGGTERPFQAELVGSVHWAFPGVSPSSCAAVTTLSDSTGQAAHLGRVMVSWSHCPAEPAYVTDGRLAMIAANGDILYGVYDYDPGSDSNSIPVTFTGGTGRFSDASGTAVVTYWTNPVFWPMPPCDPNTDPLGCMNVTVPWSAGWSFTGTINY